MIEAMPPVVNAEIDAYVAARVDATCHQLSGWTAIANRAYGLEARLLASRDAPGGRVRGVLPVIAVPRPFRPYVTSGLFGAYGPILADDERVQAELIDAARAFTLRHRAGYLHIKSLGDGSTPASFARHDVWVNAALPLDGGADGIWNRLRSSTRAAVRQAIRARLDVRVGHDGFDAFYDVLAENMHAKGSPIYGRRFFRDLLSTFGHHANVITVHLGRRAIAGALTLAHAGVTYVPFASSRPAYLRLRPNNLLYWRIIEQACDLGLSLLDFGTSLCNSSALAFKQSFGATLRPAPSFVWSRTDGQPDLGPRSRAVQVGVSAWRHLPRAAADGLGPKICRLMV